MRMRFDYRLAAIPVLLSCGAWAACTPHQTPAAPVASAAAAAAPAVVAPIEPIHAPFPMPDLQRPQFPAATFDVRQYGAVADGTTKNTDAFAKAIAAAAH